MQRIVSIHLVSEIRLPDATILSHSWRLSYGSGVVVFLRILVFLVFAIAFAGNPLVI